MNAEIKTLQVKIIEGSLSGFNAQLQAALDDGWEIYGDLHVSVISPESYSRIDYAQQVAKYPAIEKEFIPNTSAVASDYAHGGQL